MKIQLFAILCLSIAFPLFAHVNSPDVFFEGDAGPYHLNVTVRVPDVIPGVARIEIRSTNPGVKEIQITALRITGPGADLAPKPDLARVSKEDPQFFTGDLWLMLRGSWQVRIVADGTSGKGELAVPVPAVAKNPLPMKKTLGAILAVLGFILVVGLISIIGAAVREAKLEPGLIPSDPQKKRARWVMLIAGITIAIFLYLGNEWWNAEASFTASVAYKLPQVTTTLEGNRLILRLQNKNASGWSERVVLDDLIPDHDHLVHLFLLKAPDMETFFNLHPEKVETGVFGQMLPSLPAGRYQIYADVVHRTGFPETFVGEVQLPAIQGEPLSGDDCGADAKPILQANPGDAIALLPDGSQITWLNARKDLPSREATQFNFLIKDANGEPAQDLELYMGMQGHAQFVRSDRNIFAHVHPGGTISMAAFALAQSKIQKQDMHSMHAQHQELPPEISFLYGFPEPGLYRMFVQIKRKGVVQTAVFDMQVKPA